MTTIRTLALVLWASWLPPAAVAQAPAWNELSDELKAALAVKGDPARGEALFEPCVGCHRKDGSGRTSGAYPRLSGQHSTVIVKQVFDIRSGRRSNPRMEPFLSDHGMSAHEVADLAAYLQAQPVSASNGKGPGTALERGKQLYERDCAECHGTKGEGQAQKFYPSVAAQHYRYLLREAQMIRDGDRRNGNPDMIRVIKNYEQPDLEAVADYLSQLPPVR
ncbi:MAG: c-type cytochrome [Burkholderiaceae bacterium]